MILSDLQHTIGATISFEGVGLHTGEHAQLRILPQMPTLDMCSSGQTWTVPPKSPALSPMSAKRAEAQHFNLGEATVYTTEHVLAALYAAGIDNARLELNGPEVPILDGSAKPFMDAITSAGSTQQEAPRKTFRVRNNLSFRDDNGVEMLVVPGEAGEFKVTVMVDYESLSWEPNTPVWTKSVTLATTSQIVGRLFSSEKSLPWPIKGSSRVGTSTTQWCWQSAHMAPTSCRTSQTPWVAPNWQVRPTSQV